MPSKSNKQAKFMAACAHDAGYESCPPKKVAKDFNTADKKTGRLKKAMKTESLSFKQFLLLEQKEDSDDAFARQSYGTHRGTYKKTKHGYFATNKQGTTEQFKTEEQAKKFLNEGISEDDLANAVADRIDRAHPDVFSQYGLEVVNDVIRDVASFHAGTDEIGSSDISIMVQQVIKQLKQDATGDM